MGCRMNAPSRAEPSGPEDWYCDVTAEGLRRLAGVAETTRSAALDRSGSDRCGLRRCGTTLLWAYAAVGLRVLNRLTAAAGRSATAAQARECTVQLQTPQGYSKG